VSETVARRRRCAPLDLSSVRSFGNRYRTVSVAAALRAA